MSSSNGTPRYTNNFSREPPQEPSRSGGITVTRDASRSAVAELRRLSSMSGKKDLSDLQIPTITENAEDVTGRLTVGSRIREGVLVLLSLTIVVSRKWEREYTFLIVNC